MKKQIVVGSLALAIVAVSSPLLRSQAKPAQAPPPPTVRAAARPPNPGVRLGDIYLDMKGTTCVVTLKTEYIDAFRKDLIVWKIENKCTDKPQHDVELRFANSPVDNCDLVQKNVLKNKRRWLACDVPAGLVISVGTFKAFPYTVWVDGTQQSDPEVDIWP